MHYNLEFPVCFLFVFCFSLCSRVIRYKTLFLVLFERLEQCLKNLLASVSAETLGGVKELKAQLDHDAFQRRKEFADLTSSTVMRFSFSLFQSVRLSACFFSLVCILSSRPVFFRPLLSFQPTPDTFFIPSL